MKQALSDLEELRVFFWDVDINAIDLQLHKRFVIERLLQFGTANEVRWVLAHYLPADIIEVIRKSRNLDARTANFWAIHFGIPREEVRCLATSPIRNCCG
jgi:hypothetical protein